MKKINLPFAYASTLTHTIQYFIIAFILLCVSNIAAAQNAQLRGKLLDEKGVPVKYANIAVIKVNDSSFAISVLTDTAGQFIINTPAPGQYYLRFTSIGFIENRTDVFEVTSSEFSKDFGNHLLKEDKKTLKDVTVKSLRPTITQMADRMVVNVEGTAMAAGSTAFDVLGRTPGVFIDHEGNIQLNGRAGITVMLDGKLTYLSARDLRALLESMSAENIKNIEIITNPSAKYDAEGSSGILNINLKKNIKHGLNGSIYTGTNYNGKQVGLTAGGNINYKNGPWNSFLNLDFSRRVGGRESTFTRVFYGTQNTTYFDQLATGNYMAQGPPTIRIGTDYSLNDRHSIGVMGYFNTNDLRRDFLSDTWMGNAPNQPELYIDANNYSFNRFTNATGNIHYSGKLDTSGTLLSADVDYIKITNRGDANFYNYFDSLINAEPITQDFLYTQTPSGFNIFSAKIDYTQPFNKKYKLEAGAKTSRVISDNDSRFYFNNNGLELDPKRSNHFTYKENIYAAYVNFSGSLNKQLSLQLGLRAEQTQSTGRQLTTGQVTERKYLNLFPSIFVQQKPSDRYEISYNYSLRIQRPNYGNLNPFRSYLDPYTWAEGNPYLRPAYAHSFNITQTFFKKYNLILEYEFTKDVIAELPAIDVDSATTVYYMGNVDDGREWAATAVIPVKISKNWDVNNTLIVAYSKYNVEVNKQALVNDQVFYMLRSNHTIALPLDFRVELNALYRGPAAYGLFLIKPWLRVDSGIKKSFLNKKLDVTINANDLFKSQRIRIDTDINGNINNFDQYFRNRNIGVTVRYNFSKGQKIESKKSNNSLDELNRTGG